MSSTRRPLQPLRERLHPHLDISLLWWSAPLIAILVRVGLTAVAPYDYWWPIVQGRAAAQLGHLPAHNLFLYTLPEQLPFLNQPWLAQRLMWLCHESLGPAGGVWLNASLLCASFAALMWTARKLGATPRITALLTMLAAIFASNGMSVRTQMYAIPCFLVVLATGALAETQGWRVSGRIACGIAIVFWANVHGSFILAPLLLGAFAVGALIEARPRRALAPTLTSWAPMIGLALAAPCLSPSGPLIYRYVFTLSAAMGGGGNVSEWGPMPLDAPGILFYAAALASLGLLVWWRREIGWGRGLVLVGMAVLALTGQRNLVWWAMAAQLALSVGASAWWSRRRAASEQPPERALPRLPEVALNLTLCVALFMGALLCLPELPLFRALVLPESEEGLAPTDHLPYVGYQAMDTRHPLRLLGVVSQQPASARVFHSQALGGLLEYALTREAPRPVAFVDQRFEMIPMRVWDDYFAIMEAGPRWRALLDHHQITLVLLDTREDAALARALDAASGWCKIDEELSHHLYARCEAP